MEISASAKNMIYAKWYVEKS